MDRLCSAFIVWLRKQVMATVNGQERWNEIVAQLDTPPVSAAARLAEPPRPAALPPGAPVGAAQEAAAFDAFMGARR